MLVAWMWREIQAAAYEHCQSAPERKEMIYKTQTF
jgi:hypothetical protein